MGFVNVENYDGDAGYINEERLRAVSFEEKTYLGFPAHGIVYKIIKDSQEKHSALATEVRNKETVSTIEELIEKNVLGKVGSTKPLKPFL